MTALSALPSQSTPGSWETTIGALCDQFGGEVQTGPFGSQLHASDYSAEGTPVVMPQDMVDGLIVPDRAARVSGEHVKALARHALRPGDVVFSRRGDVRRFAVVTEREAGWFCGTGSIRIRLNSPEVCIRYARQYLRQESIGAWLENEAKGVTMLNLNTQIVRALPFVYPPLAEQRRIAAILDGAETLRAQRRAAIAQLDSLGQAIFLEMFGDVLANDRKWDADKTLGDVADVVSGVTKGRNLNGKAARLIPYLAVANVQDRALRLEGIKTIEATAEEIQRYRLQKNDLLLTEGGDPDKLGRGTLWNDELAEAIHQNHIFRVRLTSSVLTPLFLNWLVGSHRGKRYFLKSAKQTTGIASINMTQLRGFPILQPPLAIQELFARRVQFIEGLKTTHLAALAHLDELFASLQHRAFRGELSQSESGIVKTPPAGAVHLDDLRKLEAAVGLEALIFVAKRIPGHDVYRSLKALYFADKRHLEQHGRLVYGETHCALPHGPVPQAAYDATKVLGGERLISGFDDQALRAALRRNMDELIALRDADFTKLGNAERESLEWAIRYCGDMSFEQVKTASHDTAYNRTQPNAPIPVEYLVDMLPAEARKRHWKLEP